MITTIFSGHTIDMATLLWVGPLIIGPDYPDDSFRQADIEIALVGGSRPLRVAIIEQTKEGRGKKAVYSALDEQLWSDAIASAQQKREALIAQWEEWTSNGGLNVKYVLRETAATGEPSGSVQQSDTDRQ